jgi:hypothetical protein
LGGVFGWMGSPGDTAVGVMAGVGWALAIVTAQQSVQLRREMNALASLAKLDDHAVR